MTVPLHDFQRKLMQEPSGPARAGVAVELATHFTQGSFSASEKKIATEIFRLLVADAEVQVRAMLSAHLAQSMEIPHDIVLRLAHDVTEVAVHVLEKSYVLTEDDLIAITHSTQDTKIMSAIARRDSVSSELSEALLKKSNAAVIGTLLGNKGASISDVSLGQIYHTYNNNSSMLDLMVRRGGLPVTLAEKLFAIVSDEMKKVLTQQYKLSVQVADSTTKDVYELATLGLVGSEMHSMEIAKLVDQLYQQGRLTLSIILRSLCQGDVRFFEHAIARLADVPLGNAQLLMLDQGETGFKSLYKTSCLPMEMYDASQYLLTTVLEETSFGRYKRADFRKLLAQRLMQDERARGINYMDYLITLVQGNARDAATL
jgi:uncharacterized protein (DUF2336 family)